MRTSEIFRQTKETSISAKLIINPQNSEYQIDTTIGFLNHMLELFAKHGNFNLYISGKGDTNVDFHHIVEDIGIVLGQLFFKALNDFKGIKRYGSKTIPMDDALSSVTIDISNRPYLVYNVNFPKERVGDFDVELFEEFFNAFSNNLRCNLHIKNHYGKNSHHIIESIFKAFGYALSEAVSISGDQILSTKGTL